MTAAVRREGAVPGVTAVVAGVPVLGFAGNELERFLAREGIQKVSARDLALAMARRVDGATTVAASICLARLAGVEVFATGGIGGVHRTLADDRTSVPDESADLAELARTPVVVVCAGAKSILDLNATWERLETLGIPVLGYGTDELPGFYTAKTGIRLSARADTPDDVARVWLAQRSLGRPQALLVVQPPPAEFALDHSVVEGAVRAALGDAAMADVRGAAVTPYLLDRVTRLTGGRTLQANLALLEANAALAGKVAMAVTRLGAGEVVEQAVRAPVVGVGGASRH